MSGLNSCFIDIVFLIDPLLKDLLVLSSFTDNELGKLVSG